MKRYRYCHESEYEEKDKESGACIVQIQTRDYDSAIQDAMNAAIQAQINEGVETFFNYAEWLEQDVLQAVTGETAEKELRVRKSIYSSVQASDGKISTAIGIDFNQAENADLLEMGIINSSRGYMEYLSLKTTI